MKKTLFLLLCAPLFSIAQSYNNLQSQSFFNGRVLLGNESKLQAVNGVGNELTSEKCQELGIQKVTIERGRKKDKLSKTAYELNDLGLVARIYKKNETVNYSYVQDSLVSSIVATGKEDRFTHFDYFGSKLKKKEVFEDDRLKTRVLFDYGQQEKVSFCLMQSGRKLRTSYAMSYEYDDKKLTKQKFVRNDRLVRVWDYSCEPKGEIVDPKKLSTVCKVRSENNDGSYAENVRIIENGKVILYTHHYDKDSVNYASSCESETGEKKWESTFSKHERKYVYYSPKGHVNRTHITKYNENRQVVEVQSIFGKKQKKTIQTLKTYNAQGLITENSSFYRGKQRYIRLYTYGS